MFEGLTFDDVSLVPQFSNINSRHDVSLDCGELFASPNMTTPILSANMKTVTGWDMAKAMREAGGMGVLHRFQSLGEFTEKALHDPFRDMIVSVGVDNFIDRLAIYDRFDFLNVCIDVAHGHHSKVERVIKYIKDTYDKKFIIIAGNVCTAEGARFLTEAGADVIKVGVGPGCFSAGTRIMMANGYYKNIEEIKKGDFVIDKDGNRTKVVGTKFSGFRRVKSYKSTNFWQTSFVTYDHLHWVGDYSSIKNINKISRTMMLDKPFKNGKSKYCWKQTNELDKVFLLLPRNIKFDIEDDFEIELCNFSKRKTSFRRMEYKDKIKPSYSLGYIFGTFLGDGNISETKSNHSGYVAWSFGKNEIDIGSKLKKALLDVFNIDTSIEKNEEKSVLKILACCKPLMYLLSSFGKKTDKRLPYKYFVKNREYLRGIFDGLVDSDGYVDEGRRCISNTSIYIHELFGVVYYLLFGYFPGCYQQEVAAGNLSEQDLDKYNQSFKSKEYKIPKNCLTKNYQLVSNSKFSVEDKNLLLPTYDIEVESDTNSFVANNVIVHNSHCTTRVVTGHGVPQIDAISQVYREVGNNVDIIADGGIRNSGDIAKAIAAGANYVMVGRLLAGCSEAPSEAVLKSGRMVKVYRGSASYEAQSEYRDKRKIIAEGVQSDVPYTGPVKGVIDKLSNGLKSACSYSGANNLRLFKVKSKLIRVSTSSYVEGTPHGA